LLMPHPIQAAPSVDSRYLATVEEIAPELAMSAWTLGEACRRLEFPHVKLPHRRRILIDRRHVAAFLDGAELESKRLAGGGRIVKPAGARRQK
jgi:hypothetical protein